MQLQYELLLVEDALAFLKTIPRVQWTTKTFFEAGPRIFNLFPTLPKACALGHLARLDGNLVLPATESICERFSTKALALYQMGFDTAIAGEVCLLNKILIDRVGSPLYFYNDMDSGQMADHPKDRVLAVLNATRFQILTDIQWEEEEKIKLLSLSSEELTRNLEVEPIETQEPILL